MKNNCSTLQKFTKFIRIKMQVEQLEKQWFLPGQVISKQKITFNAINLFQNKNQNISTLRYGQIAKKQTKNDNNDKTQFLDLLTFNYSYEPQKGDLVIGVIKMKSADYYIVDIGAPLDGTLGALQFDGATKRNKPNISQGSLIYCRVIQYSKYLGAKLSCFNKGFNSKNDLGQLKGGIKIQAPRFKHNLVQKKLQLISKYLKFEIAFGKNGKIWIKTQNLPLTIVLYNVINQILMGKNHQIIIQILQTLK